MVGSVKYFRPPYRDYNSLVIETSEKYGLKAIGWNVDPRDWRRRMKIRLRKMFFLTSPMVPLLSFMKGEKVLWLLA